MERRWTGGEAEERRGGDWRWWGSQRERDLAERDKDGVKGMEKKAETLAHRERETRMRMRMRNTSILGFNKCFNFFFLG